MASIEQIIHDKKVALVGILGALAVCATVKSCEYIQDNYPFFWKEKPAVVSQVKEQDPYKYTPQRQISENPHHYIPNPK